MFSDWTIGSKVNSLAEYDKALFSAQAEAHGDDYMLVHEEIKKQLIGCNSYTEMGVNQGATLATALLTGVKKVRAYDIKLDAYNPAKQHFDKFVIDTSIDYEILEVSTLECNIEKTDLLYIDTVHIAEHLIKELARHADNAKKIIFHDTEISQGRVKLSNVVKAFVVKNNSWEIITDCVIDVGFMTIMKKHDC